MPNTRVKFQSDFGLEESVERLERAAAGPIFSSMRREFAAGAVSAQMVILQRVMPTFRNPFNPHFVGYFVQRDGRVFLVGEFRMLWATRIFLALFLGMVVVTTLSSATAPHLSLGERWHNFAAGITMLTAVLGLLGIGKLIAKHDPAWLSNVIGSVLSAPRPDA